MQNFLNIKKSKTISIIVLSILSRKYVSNGVKKYVNLCLKNILTAP